MLPDTPAALPPTLEQVQELNVGSSPGALPPDKLKEIGAVRAAALKEVALGTGARAGLEARNYQIQQVLKEHEHELDAIFNFRSLLLDSNVLPPVLIEGDNQYSQAATDSIRVVDQVYKIQAQARFVTAPPNWRDYLYKDYSGPELPHASLLPQTSAERDAWKEWVAEGWTNGVKQADTLYSDSLNRLKRDYEGMVRYRVLQAEGMVSRPFVAKSHFGVTGDSDNLNVNETTLRITALPGFNLRPEQWNIAGQVPKAEIPTEELFDKTGPVAKPKASKSRKHR
jgi:defect-in-organelle-trafficking protein DotC